MNVLVFGGSGKTGRLVVERALAKGHAVTVLVRDPIKFKIADVRVRSGNATNPSDVLSAMHGQNAVIETIGGTTPWKSTHLESDSIHAIINAMHEEHVPRLISVSMMGIGKSRAQSPFWYRSILMPTYLHGSTKDKTAKEAAITSDHVDYVIVRPPILKDMPPTGQVHILNNGAKGHAITRSDLANFLVDQLETDANLCKAVTVVNT
jgi:putative NADH-flavin reductase